MAAKTADIPPEWKRLGDLLTDRRVHLGYRERTQFCAERGVDYRLVYDIEQARRVNFTRSTIAALEVAYSLRPGAIASALAGGELEPAPAREPEPRLPEPPTSAESARRLFPGDETLQAIWRLPGLSEDERARLVEVMRELRARHAPGREDPGRSAAG